MVFFALGAFTENGLAGRLLDGDGQNHLVGLGRYFHLVFEEGEFLVDAFLHFVGGDVVERHLHLFVLLVLVVVVLFQFQRLLVLDDLLHELHGGVVLAGIFLLLGLHHDLGEHDVVRLQFDVQHPGAGLQFHFLGDIAYGGERQLIPAFAGFHLVFTVCVGDAAYTFPFILYGDVHQRFVREGVCDDTLYLGGCADGDEQ